MSGDFIFPGDYVVFDSDVECKDGEMAVVLVIGEATVKRIWRESKGAFYLESSNPKYDPITIRREDNPILQGKVIGIIKNHIRRSRSRISGELPVKLVRASHRVVRPDP
jgi:SOS-response transcriptional repressor LexA